MKFIRAYLLILAFVYATLFAYIFWIVWHNGMSLSLKEGLIYGFSGACVGLVAERMFNRMRKAKR